MITCQGDREGNACGKPATHAVIADGADTNVRMCGPDARDAVIEAVARGDRSLTAVKLDDLEHWTNGTR